MLAKEGILVEIFILESGTHNNDVWLPEKNIKIHCLPLKSKRGCLLSRLPNIFTFTVWAGNLCRGKQFSCFVGVDPVGLVSAAVLGSFFHVPWVYHSLELIISTDPIRMYRGYKNLEVWASRRSSLIIIQDEMRARLMAEDNGIPMDRFVFLPNSPIGPAFRHKTFVLHKKYGFDNEGKILFYAGSISDYFWSCDLAKVAQHFPANWKLVFQSRYSQDSLSNYFGNLLENGTVFVANRVVPGDLLPELVSSADIGIALYNMPGSPNVIYMGKSSGKLAQYLQCGLPVITNRMPGWEKWLSKYHSGVAIDSPNEVKNAVATILADYDSFSQGAISHFENELRFETAFEGLINRLHTL
ncbi:MAG: hypothetical protein PHU49_01825 [Syntrophorhabdaceae bacterium]|nr:hypothetical protein [Syntrophorhabdaceae bacterium]